MEKIRPIINKHTLQSTKNFKQFFLNNKSKIKYTKISSLDVKSLFPSINVSETIKFIIKTIYADPRKYFDIQTDENNNILDYPPANIFKTFLMEILTEFTSFTTKDGRFYRQKFGISMRSKLSTILADIYMFSVEDEIVNKYMKKDRLVAYKRYCDDIVLFTRDIESIHDIFNEFNSLDKNLKFTLELNENNSLNFLDTHIYVDNETGEFEFGIFQKEIKHDKLDNFKFSISPIKQKIGVLCGEIYRANNCSSNSKNLDRALKFIEKKFLKNSYPKKLIAEKIKEIKNRNFQKKERQNNHVEILKNTPHLYHTMCFQYTSHRIAKIGSKLIKIIKKFIPNFQLNIIHRKVNLEPIILPKLKMKKK